MKLKLILIAMIMVFAMAFALCACAESSIDPNPYATMEGDNDFVVIDEGTNGWIRFYDPDTKVVYLFYGSGNRCGITVMLDAEGKPLLWEGE